MGRNQYWTYQRLVQEFEKTDQATLDLSTEFYYHKSSKTFQWQNPTLLSKELVGFSAPDGSNKDPINQLPPGWGSRIVQRLHPETQVPIQSATMYFNTRTQASIYSDPRAYLSKVVQGEKVDRKSLVYPEDWFKPIEAIVAQFVHWSTEELHPHYMKTLIEWGEIAQDVTGVNGAAILKMAEHFFDKFVHLFDERGYGAFDIAPWTVSKHPPHTDHSKGTLPLYYAFGRFLGWALFLYKHNVHGFHLCVDVGPKVTYPLTGTDQLPLDMLERQANAIKSGFKDVIPLEWLRLFDAEEFQVLLCGENGALTVEELKEAIFWSWLRSLDNLVTSPEQRADFEDTFLTKLVDKLQNKAFRQNFFHFSIGMTRPPAEVLTAMNPPFTFEMVHRPLHAISNMAIKEEQVFIEPQDIGTRGSAHHAIKLDGGQMSWNYSKPPLVITELMFSIWIIGSLLAPMARAAPVNTSDTSSNFSGPTSVTVAATGGHWWWFTLGALLALLVVSIIGAILWYIFKTWSGPGAEPVQASPVGASAPAAVSSIISGDDLQSSGDSDPVGDNDKDDRVRARLEKELEKAILEDKMYKSEKYIKRAKKDKHTRDKAIEANDALLKAQSNLYYHDLIVERQARGLPVRPRSTLSARASTSPTSPTSTNSTATEGATVGSASAEKSPRENNLSGD